MSRNYTGRRRLLDDEAVIRRYQELRDSYTVGLEAGIDASKVLEICRAAGVETNTRGHRVSRKKLRLTDEEIVERYRNGDSGETVAYAAGCSNRTVYHILERFGVERRPATIGLMRGRRRGVASGGKPNG